MSKITNGKLFTMLSSTRRWWLDFDAGMDTVPALIQDARHELN